MNSSDELSSLDSSWLDINDNLFKNFWYSNLKSTFESILPFVDNENVKALLQNILNSINIIIANESLEASLKRTKEDILAILKKADNTAIKISSDFLLELQDYVSVLYENDKQDIFSETSRVLSNLKEELDSTFEVVTISNVETEPDKKESNFDLSNGLTYYFDSIKKKINNQAEANREAFLWTLIKKIVDEINKQCFLEWKAYIANLRMYIEKGWIKNKRPSLNPFYDYINPHRRADNKKMDRNEFKTVKELIWLHEEKKRKWENLLSKNMSEKTKISYFLLATAVFTMLKNTNNHDDVIGLQEEKFYLLIDINDSVPKWDTDMEKALNIKKASIILRDLIDIIRYYISNFKKNKIEYVTRPRRTNLEKALEKKEPWAAKAMEYIDLFEDSIEDDNVTKEEVLNLFFSKALLDIIFSIFKQLWSVVKVDKFEDILNNEMFSNSIIFKDVLVLKMNNSKNKKSKKLTKIYHFLNKDWEDDDSLLNSSKKYVDDLLAKLYEANKANLNAFEMKNIDLLIDRQQLHLNFYDLKDVYISYIGEWNFIILYKKKDFNPNANMIETSLKSSDTKTILNAISYFVNEFLVNRWFINL